MVHRNQPEGVVTTTSIQDYFRRSVDDALDNQNVDATEATTHYIVNVLTSFARADQLFEHTPEGLRLRPLALLYAEALEQASARLRFLLMRRLGDVALFVAGMFSESLNRKLVDLDYYIAMGGNAYAYLSDTAQDTVSGKAMADVFHELAHNFTSFVDVLQEVSEGGTGSSDKDLLEVYDVWLRTGSTRAARQLQKLGVHLEGRPVWDSGH